MRIDRMGIIREDTDTTTDTERYGSLYPVHLRHNNVNDYGGSDTDAAKLANITNAATGSTCLYSSGRIDRLELDGWAEFGESGTQTRATPSLTTLNLNRKTLVTPLEETEQIESEGSEGKESTLEAQKSAVTSSTAEKVSV